LLTASLRVDPLVCYHYFLHGLNTVSHFSRLRVAVGFLIYSIRFFLFFGFLRDGKVIFLSIWIFAVRGKVWLNFIVPSVFSALSIAFCSVWFLSSYCEVCGVLVCHLCRWLFLNLLHFRVCFHLCRCGLCNPSSHWNCISRLYVSGESSVSGLFRGLVAGFSCLLWFSKYLLPLHLLLLWVHLLSVCRELH
jgi:hypothetical protein